MKCKVGDRVRFLNDVGGGKVTRVIKNTVYVLGDDGFEVPVLMSEVLVINQSTDSTIQNQVQEERERPEIQSKSNNLNVSSDNLSNDSIAESHNQVDDLAAINFADSTEEKDFEGQLVGLLLAFVPINQNNIVDSDHELYIINDSPYRVFYTISKWAGEGVVPIRAGFIYADTKELVGVFKREELNADLTLNIQTLFFKNIGFIPQQPEYYDLRTNPTKFFRPGSFSENDFFEEKALIYSIADSKKEELLKTLTSKAISDVIKDKDSRPKSPEKVIIPEVEEVDLHIHELVDNPNDYTPGQMIEIQLARFKVALEGGIKGKTRKMVFIHGVGNGRLKHEIRKELEKNYSKYRYQDASFREYGFGATMVFLKG